MRILTFGILSLFSTYLCPAQNNTKNINYINNTNSSVSSINSLDDSIVLQSIANIETNNCFWKIGRKHEKTKYQFIESTWYQYSDIPFLFIDQHNYQQESDRVALAHLSDIKRFLIARNQYSLSNVGWVWNAGFGAYKKGKLPNSTKKYIGKLNKEYKKLIAQN